MNLIKYISPKIMIIYQICKNASLIIKMCHILLPNKKYSSCFHYQWNNGRSPLHCHSGHKSACPLQRLYLLAFTPLIFFHILSLHLWNVCLETIYTLEIFILLLSLHLCLIRETKFPPLGWMCCFSLDCFLTQAGQCRLFST